MTGIVDELKRQSKITDMMITMYSIQKVKYYNMSLFVDIVLIISSAILTIFIYFDYNLLKELGINVDYAKTTINVSSILTFLMSLISLVVDWKGKSEKNDQACNQLSRLKDEYRVILSEPTKLTQTTLKEQTDKYNQLFSMLPKIPNKLFNKLKLKHKKKVELSKLIDKYPGANIWVLRIKLSYIFNKKVITNDILDGKTN